ncbi:MAG: late competence development ComFB family protein [Cyanobacteria bacterium P01_C01_bin.118]
MVDVKAPPPREYINVMELLVAEEVEQQLRQLPTRVLKYVKPIEVETYALNRLPCLYASSEKGWHSQYQKARHELRQEISNAVRQAIAAVQVDPLRASRPLIHRPAFPSNDALLLEQFRSALGQPNLTWESLLRKCKRAGAARRESMANKDDRSSAPEASYATAYATAHTGQTDTHGTVWRPGTYGETSWHPKRNHDYQKPMSSSSMAAYDWNDSRYR